MIEEEISYKTLRRIQQMEKNSPILVELTPDFYSALSQYLTNLEKRLENETVSQKKTLLQEEISNTKKIAVNIYEQREKKILTAAVTKARGGSPEMKNMIGEEKNLFEMVYNVMLNSRKQILEQETTKEIIVETKTVENKVEIEEENKEEKNECKETRKENTNHIMRVTEDIPEFIGTDEKRYSLRKNDVISLPKDMSEMLVKRKVIEKIE